MAGLLAYAAEGAAKGLGEGLADVGAQSLKTIQEQGLEKMRNDYATSRQQAGFAHEDVVQGKNQDFEKNLKEEEITASTNSATAGRQERAEQAKTHEEHADTRNAATNTSRESVARIRADAAAAGKNAPKPWSTKGYQVTTYDPKTHLPITNSVPLATNPNNGALYAQIDGGKMVRWDAQKNAPQAYSRVPVQPGELQRLYKNPNAVVPMGLRGSGMTELENFERIHGFIPAGIMSHVTGGGMVNDSNPMSEEGNAADDAAYDAESAAQAADDNAPAKEP